MIKSLTDYAEAVQQSVSDESLDSREYEQPNPVGPSRAERRRRARELRRSFKHWRLDQASSFARLGGIPLQLAQSTLSRVFDDLLADGTLEWTVQGFAMETSSVDLFDRVMSANLPAPHRLWLSIALWKILKQHRDQSLLQSAANLFIKSIPPRLVDVLQNKTDGVRGLSETDLREVEEVRKRLAELDQLARASRELSGAE